MWMKKVPYLFYLLFSSKDESQEIEVEKNDSTIYKKPQGVRKHRTRLANRYHSWWYIEQKKSCSTSHLELHNASFNFIYYSFLQLWFFYYNDRDFIIFPLFPFFTLFFNEFFYTYFQEFYPFSRVVA